MSTTAKILILTWVVIGFVIVGAVGFYLGRVTAPPKIIQLQQGNLPTGGQPQGGSFMPQKQQMPPGGNMQQSLPNQ